MKKLSFALLLTALLGSCATAPEELVGNTGFVHIEKIDGNWWLVDAEGQKFISTGMNHIQSNIRFSPHNKEFWAQKFGEDILVNGRYNPKAIPENKKWLEQVHRSVIIWSRTCLILRGSRAALLKFSKSCYGCLAVPRLS